MNSSKFSSARPTLIHAATSLTLSEVGNGTPTSFFAASSSRSPISRAAVYSETASLRSALLGRRPKAQQKCQFAAQPGRLPGVASCGTSATIRRPSNWAHSKNTGSFQIVNACNGVLLVCRRPRTRCCPAYRRSSASDTDSSVEKTCTSPPVPIAAGAFHPLGPIGVCQRRMLRRLRWPHARASRSARPAGHSPTAPDRGSFPIPPAAAFAVRRARSPDRARSRSRRGSRRLLIRRRRYDPANQSP